MSFSMGMPVRDGQLAAAGETQALELRLLNARLVFRDLSEFRRAMRHRYVLAGSAGLTVPAVFLLYGLDASGAPIDLQVPAVVVGLLAAQILLALYLRMATAVMRTVHRQAPVCTVWMTPGLTLGAAGMLAVIHLLHVVMIGGMGWAGLDFHLLPFICVLYLEFAATFLFRGPMRRALAKLREGQEPLPALIGQPEPDAPTVTAREGQDTPGPSRQGAVPGFDVHDILRLEAAGNYVTVVTRTGRHLVPGPFAAVVAQMPEGMGRQVQRSHWVSRAAVERFYRKGRDFWLKVSCGAEIPVSAAQKAQVQAWLELQAKPLPARREGSDIRAMMKPAPIGKGVQRPAAARAAK